MTHRTRRPCAAALILLAATIAGCGEPDTPVIGLPDGVAPADLIAQLMTAPSRIAVVDLRDERAFASFHLPSAVRMTSAELLGARGRELLATPERRVVICGTRELTRRPRDQLRAAGHEHVAMLSHDLDDVRQAWFDRPPGLVRLTRGLEYQIELQRAFLLGPDPTRTANVHATDPVTLATPTMVSTDWLADHRDEVAVVDVRSKPEWQAFHVPGAVQLSVRDLRQKNGERHVLLRPRDELAAHFGSLGLTRDTPIVIVCGQRLLDATFAATALQLLGHERMAILEGGMLCWASQRRALSDEPTAPQPARYVPSTDTHDFSMATDDVAMAVEASSHAIIDARPARAFANGSSGDARPGHIPGATNRPFAADVIGNRRGVWLRPRHELAARYRDVMAEGTTDAVVCCRTGHAATQTLFVLRHVLGRDRVHWYNGSWTEWSQREDLPVERGPGR